MCCFAYSITFLEEFALSLKKITTAGAILAGTLLLAGCGGKLPFSQQKPNFDTTYTVNAEITYDKVSAKAEVTRVSGEEWNMTFTEPKNLKGLTVKLNDKKYSATLDGLSFSSENSGVYATAPHIIAGAVGELISTDAENSTASDGVLTYKTELDGASVTITANEKTGELISLKCPQNRLSVNFSGQKPYTLQLPDEDKATIS